MLACAEYRVEQRAIAGFIKGFADWPLTFDKEGFLAFASGDPFTIGLVQQAIAFTLDPLQKQILVVPHDHGHAPTEFAVEAGDNSRDAGDGDASGLEFRRADLHEVPRRWHGQWQVRVVGQQALATAAVLRRDGPVVRGGHAEHMCLGKLAAGSGHGLQPGNLSVELEALELVAFLER